jgi:hypothetical protein
MNGHPEVVSIETAEKLGMDKVVIIDESIQALRNTVIYRDFVDQGIDFVLCYEPMIFGCRKKGNHYTLRRRHQDFYPLVKAYQEKYSGKNLGK